MSMIIKDVKLESSDGLHLINPQKIFSLKNNAQLCIKQLLIIQFSEQIFPFCFSKITSVLPHGLSVISTTDFYLYSGCRIQM